MFIVSNQDDVAKALLFISQHEVLAYDTETTGLNVRKDRVIGFGVSTADDGFYLPLWVWSRAAGELQPTGIDPAPVLQALTAKKLLMFNASFDARVTANNLGVDLLPALHTDVLLLKHTCDEEFPFGLKEISAKIFGTSVLQEKAEMQTSIKAAGGSATEYFKAECALIAKYCVQDTKLTYRLYNHYSRELERQGLRRFFYQDEVMPLYREVTIPMEAAGVRLDMLKLQNALAEICNDLREIEAKIQHAVAPHLDKFTAWFLNKDYPADNGSTFRQGIAEFYGLALPRTASGAISLTAKAISALPDSYAKSVLQNQTKLAPQVVLAIQKQLFAKHNPNQYMFNLLSKHHLKKLFFETLNEQALSFTDLGNPQVDEEFLDSIASKYQWVPWLIDYNKLVKLKGTYIERLLNESENGRFYPSYLQHRTVSGRYAGDLQQLPRPLEPGQASDVVIKHNNKIREFVVPDVGNSLVSADYEQLEPTIFAHTSCDKTLQNIFKAGLDFYSEVAIRTERIANVSADKSAPNYLGRLNKSARQKAKAYALGIAYGMTGYKLKFEIDCSPEEADQLVKDYLAGFPDLAAWMQASKETVLRTGEIRTQAGRVRHMPLAKRLYAQYGEAITCDLKLWKAYHQAPDVYKRAKTDRKTFKNLMNNAINFQVQGLAASIVNRAAIAITRRLNNAGLKAYLCMQVHDELVLNVPIAETETVSGIVQDLMQNIVKLTVPLRTVPQVGTNFRECK